MQNLFQLSRTICLFVIATTFFACQSEEPFEADINAEHTLTATSTVIDLMRRTSSKDGSYDNIVDGASCVAIQFPYSVVVNGSELVIAAMEDLAEIEKILDAADAEHVFSSVDEVQKSVIIQFPVTVMLSDQTETIIDSETVLQEYAKQCVEGGNDADIECVDMKYPIGLFTYNPDLQQTGSITVGHDQELRRFLAGLSETDLISIDFPLTYILHDSTEVTANSNAAFADAMQSAIDSCDEDDDSDYNDDDFTKESLDSLLIACPWSVTKPEPVVEDSVVQVQEDVLVFLENGTLILDDGAAPDKQGKWSVTVSDFDVFVTMEFQEASDFNGSRYTYKIGEGLITMDRGENGELHLEQRCEIMY